MIISKIHLPTNDNNGVALDEIHAKLERALVKHFDGCTVTEGQGLWMHQGKLFKEPVKIYEIAMHASEPNTRLFLELVHEYGARAHQLAMYCAIDKHVTIIDVVKPTNQRPSPSKPN